MKEMLNEEFLNKNEEVRKFNLEDRLVDFAVRVIKVVEELPNVRAGYKEII